MEPFTVEQGQGLLRVYSGECRKEAEAAYDLALTALENGLRVFVIQFRKPFRRSDDMLAHRECENLVVCRMVYDGWVPGGEPDSDSARAAAVGMATAIDAIFSRDYDLVVLDRITDAIQDGYIDTDEVMSFLCKRPATVDIVITGGPLPCDIARAADVLTTF